MRSFKARAGAALVALACAVLPPGSALAASAMETVQILDGSGAPFGTSANPFFVSGGGGGGGSTGSVTAPGTSGTQAQAVQGITGGVPVAVTGGPPASTAYSVQRTTGIGTTGTLVSAADSVARRTVTNIGTIACELATASGSAYGTGFPLPAGGSFTFDASGRTTAAIYVACASAGGATAVLSY